jgi:hypothetical protein
LWRLTRLAASRRLGVRAEREVVCVLAPEGQLRRDVLV